MRRREFIGLAGAAAAWPLMARAQQGERVRRVAVLMSLDNSEQRTNHAAFIQSLKQVGWVDGQNVRIETRWAMGEAALIRKNATDAIATAPAVSLEPYRSCLHKSPTQWARVLSKQWRGQEATLRVLFNSTTA